VPSLKVVTLPAALQKAGISPITWQELLNRLSS